MKGRVKKPLGEVQKPGKPRSGRTFNWCVLHCMLRALVCICVRGWRGMVDECRNFYLLRTCVDSLFFGRRPWRRPAGAFAWIQVCSSALTMSRLNNHTPTQPMRWGELQAGLERMGAAAVPLLRLRWQPAAISPIKHRRTTTCFVRGWLNG